MADVVEVTVLEDGSVEVVERDFTSQEKSQRKADETAAALAAQEAAAAAAIAAQNGSDAIAHAKSLGFTDAMITAMYPALVSVAP